MYRPSVCPSTLSHPSVLSVLLCSARSQDREQLQQVEESLMRASERTYQQLRREEAEFWQRREAR